MEEIELRDALRHHLSAAEPPMGLNATDLLSKGRRRHRWRLGLRMGTGATLAMAGAIALIPGLGVSPSLDASSCSVPLVTDYAAPPSTEPDYPQPTIDPGAYPSGYPSSVPSPYPTNDRTPDPTHNATSYPTDSPQPDPSNFESYATRYPVSEASGSERDRLPENLTASYPPDEPRMREMECYLKRELKRQLPEAKFARYGDQGPLTVSTAVDLRWAGRDQDLIYYANAIVIGTDQTIQLTIAVMKPWQAPTGPEDGWSFEQHGSLVVRQLTREDGMSMIEIYTGNSAIFTTSTGTLLSAEQLFDLTTAVELDMFRPA
jgi:hypothetical protein